MDAEKENILTEAKPRPQSATSSIMRTVISLALFIAVDYLIFKSWSAVFLLVTVIFLHECGHFIAMKIFGYKGINMTFVPFMGAYVSGEATHFSKSKKIIMLLAGPVPGIIIGMLLFFIYQHNLNEYYYLAALAFLLLNVFNLLPVSPLDGGQVIETLFFSGNEIIQIGFLYFSLIVILGLLYAYQYWLLIIIGWFIYMRIRSLHLTYRVRRELDKKNISYHLSYDDLANEHYAQIRDVLVTFSKTLGRRFIPGEFSYREGELVNYVEKILAPAYHYNLSRAEKIIFSLVYLLAFLLPLIQWGYLKDWY
ncbi:MAG: site-2 protease family protein [Ferruginibacter sp.]